MSEAEAVAQAPVTAEVPPASPKAAEEATAPAPTEAESPTAPAADEIPPQESTAPAPTEAEVTAAIEKQSTNMRLQAKYDREALQNDPTNPLYSESENFEGFGLRPELVKGVVAQGFRKPSGIQARALPKLIATNEDVIVQSQSGTGKTATFSLTTLQKIDVSVRQVQGIILSPSRELAIQTAEEVRKLGQFLEGLEVSLCVPMEKYPETPSYGHVVVGTIGRVYDLVTKRKEINLDTVNVVVIDEADDMLRAGSGNQSHGQQSVLLMKSLNRKKTQIILVSATFPTSMTKYVQQVLPGCKNMFKLEGRAASLKLDYIHHFYTYFPPPKAHEQKCKFIKDALELCDINQTIIFCNQKTEAEKIHEYLSKDKFCVGLLTSNLEKDARDAVMEKFRNAETRILISTNVIARGVDVVQTSVVINFEVPTKVDDRTRQQKIDPETYVHRAGRTGRFGRPGVCISFLSTKEDVDGLMHISKEYGFEMKGLSRDGAKLAETFQQGGLL
eukprot:PhF_6_TR25112/c0_g1_i1/m.34527/K18655/DDX19, DBP5; ATP-dependent RNA helicase DDX19/DBP5